MFRCFATVQMLRHNRLLTTVKELHQCIKFLSRGSHLPNRSQKSILYHVEKRFTSGIHQRVQSIHAITTQGSVEKSSDLSDNKNEDDFEEIIQRLTEGDPDKEKQLRVLQMEAEMCRQEGLQVPDHIKESSWAELMNIKSRSGRKKYLRYLFLCEKRSESDRKKRQIKREQWEEKKKEMPEKSVDDDPYSTNYGLSGNTIFMRFRDQMMMHVLNSNLIKAMMFEQTIVVDCGYEQYMSRQESNTCANQLQILFAENRFHRRPFNVVFCNSSSQDKTMKMLRRFIPILYEPTFPLRITSEDYLNLFPREKLVYLTPHAQEEMKKFDHDAIYIIGAMVDKTNSEPLSLAKAKKQGLKMVKLPFDQYLQWGSGNKCLTLNQIMQILLEIRDSGDWNKALKFVPQRKLMRDNVEEDLETLKRRFGASRKKQEYFRVKSLYQE